MSEYNEIDGIPVFGDIQENAVQQIKDCAKHDAYGAALMADHHLGYSQPIGGVIAYKGLISPSGVGYDIACGNKAVAIDIPANLVIDNISVIMDDIFDHISFGVGRKNKTPVDSSIFYTESAWDIVDEIDPTLREKAYAQLGTIGSGNHYVDVFIDDKKAIWCGVHFGSRGLGHAIANYFVKKAGGKDGINALPTLIEVDSLLGQEYIACMELAGKYAYAGRDWVCQKVADILGGDIQAQVHNHHNFAWKEEHFGEELWVVRKGATPAFPNEMGFVGGSMGDNSVILKGVDSERSKKAFYSTVHGAGRVMSRTEASGKKKWKKGKVVKTSEGKVSRQMMEDWIKPMGVELRGAGTDESPHCYKRLEDVLEAHKGTVEVIRTLTPLGVAMAGEDEFDPYKD